MAVRLEYALNTHASLVHVTNVTSGLACNCTCPHCHEKLIAKNKSSNKVSPHFQHHKTQECSFAVETSLHLLAKEVIEQTKQLRLPSYKERFTIKDKKYRGWGPLYDEEKEFLVAELVKVEKVEIEKYLDTIRPDLIIWVRDEPILIEIYVSHRVDEEKLIKIREKDIATIEIDLHKTSRQIDENLLTDILQSAECSNWIYHPAIEGTRESIKEEINELVVEEQNRRDKEYSFIKKKRWRKQHKQQYLDKAKKWIRTKNSFQLIAIENKYNYSIFKRVNENWVIDCPIIHSPEISRCLFCEYNSHFNTQSKKRYLSETGNDLDFIKCLYDLMRDRYFNNPDINP
ncbi:MAG: hypothetical protein RIC06_00025 [Cyclobacteriaceae bacterium]